MSSFVPTKRNSREGLLLCFHLKKSAAESYRTMQEAYGVHAPSISTCKYWFRRFSRGDFDTEDKERPGQPKKFNDKELEALLDQDCCQTQKELAKSLEVTQSTISERLKAAGFIQKQGQSTKRKAQSIEAVENGEHIAEENNIKQENNIEEENNIVEEPKVKVGRGGRKEKANVEEKALMLENKEITKAHDEVEPKKAKGGRREKKTDANKEVNGDLPETSIPNEVNEVGGIEPQDDTVNPIPSISQVNKIENISKAAAKRRRAKVKNQKSHKK